MPAAKESLRAIKATYDLLNDNFEAAYDKAQTAAQRTSVRDLHAAARDAYFVALAKVLDDNNSVVKGVRKDLVEANGQIAKALKNLQSIVGFLKVVTEAVRLAAALAALAAVA